MNDIRAGLLRALAFHDVWGYAPTRVEWLASFDAGSGSLTQKITWSQASTVADELIKEGIVMSERGRVTFPTRQELIAEHELREALFPHKIRRARSVARWLRRLSGVRFVALCNTTALAHAREEGDLDFFIVTKTGALWQTRGAAALPFKLLGARPGDTQDEKDAVCLSFFVDESSLDLTPLQILPDDPYFRHWFLSLLPLYDEGVGEKLWKANACITGRHSLAECWLPHPTLAVTTPLLRGPMCSSLEAWAKQSQQRLLPAIIQQTANQSTNVVVTDHILKLHTTDARAEYREKYNARCKEYEVEP